MVAGVKVQMSKFNLRYLDNFQAFLENSCPDSKLEALEHTVFKQKRKPLKKRDKKFVNKKTLIAY